MLYHVIILSDAVTPLSELRVIQAAAINNEFSAQPTP